MYPSGFTLSAATVHPEAVSVLEVESPVKIRSLVFVALGRDKMPTVTATLLVALIRLIIINSVRPTETVPEVVPTALVPDASTPTEDKSRNVQRPTVHRSEPMLEHSDPL